MPDEPEKSKENEDSFPKPRPAGEPDAVVKVRELIEAKLAEMVTGYAADDVGSYILGMDSARIFVVPTWIEEDTTVIRIFAITNLDVPVTAGLTSWLLAKNLEFVFGAFALDVENGAIWFNHNLLGKYADPEQLEASIAAVAQTADQYDNEIKDQFGGRLYVEAPASAGPTPPTPGYL